MATPLILLALLWLTSCSSPGGGPSDTSGSLPLAPQIDAQGSITFEVRPLYNGGKEVKFAITIDTRSGSLDFDLVQVAYLEDGRGNKYLPQRWEGSGSGGRHRSGTLLFPLRERQPSSLRLTIVGVEVPQRVFTWGLPRP